MFGVLKCDVAFGVRKSPFSPCLTFSNHFACSQMPLMGHHTAHRAPGKMQLALVNILGGMIVGYCTAIIAGATAGLEADWGKLSSGMSGLLTSSVILGAAIGSLVGGLVADRIGRQKSAILMSLGALVFCLAEAASPNMGCLLVMRLFLGLFVGLASVVCPLYVSETAPSESRGFLGSFFQVSIAFGVALAYVSGYLLRPESLSYQNPAWVKMGGAALSWRIMFGLGAIVPLFLLYVALFVMRESPIWLEQRANEGYRPALESSSSSSSMSFSNPFSSASEAHGWRGLFSRASLLPLTIGIVLAVDLQATGINGILFYLPKLLTGAGLGDLAPILTIVVGVFNFLSTFFALFLVDRVGRKPLLLIGTAILGASLLLVGIAFYAMEGKVRGWFAFAAILVFHLGFEVGPGSLFWIVIAEVFPLGVRSEANGFINLINNLLNLLVCLLFPIVFAAAKGSIFFFFAIMAALSFAYLLFAYKDSKNEPPLQQMHTLQ